MLDVIETLYDGGEFDSEGNVIVGPVEIPGWHVNSTREVPEWAGYKTEPTTPRRVFGGAQTFFYMFPDKETFEQAAIDAGFIYDAETGVWSDPTDSEPKPEVPRSVSMRQARLVLLQYGLLDQVNSVLASLPSSQKEAAQIEWEYAQDVARDSPLVQALTLSLGLSNQQMDDLFKLGATL